MQVSNLGASVRWRRAAVWSQLVYRREFAAWGEGSVMVRPHILRGVDRISIGSGCTIYDGAWLQCEYPEATISLGDACYVGHRVHVHAGSPVSIGDRCWITDDVYIGSLDHDNGAPTSTHATGPVTIGDGVFLGVRAIVLGGVTIGDGARVGANAVVVRDVPAGATVAGVPASVLRSS